MIIPGVKVTMRSTSAVENVTYFPANPRYIFHLDNGMLTVSDWEGPLYCRQNVIGMESCDVNVVNGIDQWWGPPTPDRSAEPNTPEAT